MIEWGILWEWPLLFAITHAWSCVTSYFSPLWGSHCHTVNPAMGMMLCSSMLAFEKVYYVHSYATPLIYIDKLKEKKNGICSRVTFVLRGLGMLTFFHDSLHVLASPRAAHRIVNPLNFTWFVVGHCNMWLHLLLFCCICYYFDGRCRQSITRWPERNPVKFLSLRGNCTPNQELSCFVLYLKIINTFLKNDMCIL